MDTEELRQFLTDLEQLVVEAGLGALVEYERMWTRATVAHEWTVDAPPDQDPDGAEGHPGSEEVDALLHSVAVLLDLVEAAVETRYDVEQEVLAMVEWLEARDLITEPRVTFAAPTGLSRASDDLRVTEVDEESEYAFPAYGSGATQAAAQRNARPMAHVFDPIWRMRDELGLSRDRQHPIVVATRPSDWSKSWRLPRG